MSGRNQHIANVPYGKLYRGFKSLLLRHFVKQPQKGNIMEFSEEQLLVIESALMAARADAVDEDWHDELSEVLVEVRREIEKD